MKRNILLAILIIAILNIGAFSFEKVGIGVSSVNLDNLSATGIHIVVNPISSISLRVRMYGSNNYYSLSPSLYYSGAQISCLYNFPPIINSRVIPQLGCSFDGWQIWTGYHDLNATQYTFNLLLGAEWFIYDFLSINFSWPFISTQSRYGYGKLESARTYYFNGALSAGLTLYL